MKTPTLKLAPSTVCKIRRVWFHTANMTVVTFMVLGGASAGWNARDVVNHWDREEMKMELARQQARFDVMLAQQQAGFETRRQHDSQEIRTTYELLIQEKDARIAELAHTNSKTATEAVTQAKKAVTQAQRAVNASSAPVKTSPALKDEIAKTNRRIQEKADK